MTLQLLLIAVDIDILPRNIRISSTEFLILAAELTSKIPWNLLFLAYSRMPVWWSRILANSLCENPRISRLSFLSVQRMYVELVNDILFDIPSLVGLPRIGNTEAIYFHVFYIFLLNHDLHSWERHIEVDVWFDTTVLRIVLGLVHEKSDVWSRRITELKTFWSLNTLCFDWNLNA